MATSLAPSLSEIAEGAPIPAATLAYFQERLRNRLHQLVLREFVRQEGANGLTKAALALRLGKRPEQITRWLGAPGNWTLDTVSDLLLGMGLEPTFGMKNVIEARAVSSAAEAAPLPQTFTQVQNIQPMVPDEVHVIGYGFRPRPATRPGAGTVTDLLRRQPPAPARAA